MNIEELIDKECKNCGSIGKWEIHDEHNVICQCKQIEQWI